MQTTGKVSTGGVGLVLHVDASALYNEILTYFDIGRDKYIGMFLNFTIRV